VDQWGSNSLEDVYFSVNSTDRIWNVLQSPAGIQVCVEFNGGGGLCRINFTVSVNGFESGGAWRNAGSVGPTARPTDVASTPDWGREIPTSDATNGGGCSLLPGGAISPWVYIWVRDDGKGFIYCVRDLSVSAASDPQEKEGKLFILTSVTNPSVGDNPYVMFIGNYDLQSGQFIYDDPSAESHKLIGRITTTVVKWGLVEPGTATTSAPLTDPYFNKDPFSNAEIQLPLAIWTNQVSPKQVRHTLRDIYAIRRNFYNFGQTLSNYTRFVVGDFSLPWNGTDYGQGPDLPAFVYPILAIDTGGNTAAATKAFNLGVEVL